MKNRRLALVLVVLMCTLVLSGCSGPESTYNAAQKLMANGDYVAAAEKFDSIGSYEDAFSLAMYCKAIAMGESGNYADAITGLESLGDFKDSGFMRLYYEALSFEAAGDRIKAIQHYEAISLFRDSATRANNLIAEMYTEGTSYAKEEDFANAWLIMYTLNQAQLVYEDSETLEKYYSLRGREMSVSSTDYDELIFLADAYDEFKYADSVSRASKIRKSVYDKGKASFDNKNYDDAIKAFTTLGDYSVSELMLEKSVKYKEITSTSTAELLGSIMSDYVRVCDQSLDVIDTFFDDPEITLEDIRKFEDSWQDMIDTFDVALEIFFIATPEDGHVEIWNNLHSIIQATKEECQVFTNLDPNGDGIYTSEEMNALWSENWPRVKEVCLEAFNIIRPYAN